MKVTLVKVKKNQEASHTSYLQGNKMKKLLFLIALLTLVQATQNRIGLTTTFPNGATHLECVYVQEGLNAEQVLSKSVLKPVFTKTTSLGKALVKVGNIGCSPEDPWCQCKTIKCCLLWNLWYNENTSLEFSKVGYSQLIPKNNSVIASAWGFDYKSKPPQFSIEYICSHNNTVPNANYSSPETCSELNESQRIETLTQTVMQAQHAQNLEQKPDATGTVILVLILAVGIYMLLNKN